MLIFVKPKYSSPGALRTVGFGLGVGFGAGAEGVARTPVATGMSAPSAIATTTNKLAGFTKRKRFADSLCQRASIGGTGRSREKPLANRRARATEAPSYEDARVFHSRRHGVRGFRPPATRPFRYGSRRGERQSNLPPTVLGVPRRDRFGDGPLPAAGR